MLTLFDRYDWLFTSWHVVRYEQEEGAYMLHIDAHLIDGSLLKVRDYLFFNGERKYSYHWMNADKTLRRRWDNAPHWPDVATFPHHVHVADEKSPRVSVITNLEDLLVFLEDYYSSRMA